MKTYIQANKAARKAIQTAQAIRKRKEETELKQKLAFEIEQRTYQRELDLKILPYVLLIQRAFRRYRRRMRSMSITRSYRLHVRDVAKQVRWKLNWYGSVDSLNPVQAMLHQRYTAATQSDRVTQFLRRIPKPEAVAGKALKILSNVLQPEEVGSPYFNTHP